MSVTEFPKPKEPEIWVCACDCSTFNLRSDGVAECASCGEIAEAGCGGWYDGIRNGPMRDEELEAPIRDVQGNGSVEFARRRISQFADAEDAVAVVVLRDRGGIHTWTSVETEEQIAWLARRMGEAIKIMSRGGAA